MDLKLFNDVCISLFVLAQTVQLKCYACQSSTGWDDCVSAQKEMTCALGNDRCGSVFVDVKSSAGSAATYAKGCLSHSECVGGVDCCSGNLCNSGIPETSIAQVKNSGIPSSVLGPVVSVIMVLACSIVAFVR